jgi:hypothetical protein
MREISLNRHRSQKCRQCTWCGESIDIGDYYFKRVYMHDRFTVDNYHEECYRTLCESDNNVEYYPAGEFERGVPSPGY